MVPRADIVALALDHAAARRSGPVPHRRPFAPAGLRGDARRSARHDPHPRLRRSSSPPIRASAWCAGRRGRRAGDGPKSASTCPCRPPRILRPVLYAPPSMPALDLLVKMQASRTHMALVIDEYGGTDGLVSIEDVVESIVGDIEDEHDEAEPPDFSLPATAPSSSRRALRWTTSPRRSGSISPRSPTPRRSTRSAAS